MLLAIAVASFIGFSALLAGGWSTRLIETEAESVPIWTDSTNNIIALCKGATDPYWNYLRVRFWKVKEIP